MLADWWRLTPSTHAFLSRPAARASPSNSSPNQTSHRSVTTCCPIRVAIATDHLTRRRMKDPADFFREYGQRVAALPTPSINEPQCSADLPIQIIQANRRWRVFPVQPQNRLVSAKVRIEDATADLAQLEQWASNSQAAIGPGYRSRIRSLRLGGRYQKCRQHVARSLRVRLGLATDASDECRRHRVRILSLAGGPSYAQEKPSTGTTSSRESWASTRR